jgi:hypothetical protein
VWKNAVLSGLCRRQKLGQVSYGVTRRARWSRGYQVEEGMFCAMRVSAKGSAVIIGVDEVILRVSDR